jgi:hypothetical protein
MRLYFVHVHLLEGSLQDLKVLNVLVLELRAEFHLLHRDGACNTVQCSAVQCSAVQCSAVQCSAVQCSA